jgi:hypothetical protein
MKYTARLETESADAPSVSRALDVDNIKLKGLEISSTQKGGKIITEVGSNSLPTLINTLDDLISCQMAAEKLLTKNNR